MKPSLLLLAALTALSPSVFCFQLLETVPRPLSAVRRPGAFSISSETRIILGDGTGESDRALVEILNDRVEAHSPRRLRIVDEQNVRTLTKGSIYIATSRSDFVRPALRARGASLRPSMDEEGYILDIRSEGVVLVAHSERGRAYGMMTLLSLLHTNGRRLLLPHLTIHDWPSRAQRAIRLDVGDLPGHGLEIACRLIPFCGAVKLNMLVLELSRAPAGASLRSTELNRLQALAHEHRIELAIQTSPGKEADQAAPIVRLGFLPPGARILASIAAAAHTYSAPDPLVPLIVLDRPRLYSAHWLEYVAAWIAENTWSDRPADLGSFSQAFLRIVRKGEPGEELVLGDLTMLQNSPLTASWDELWIRPTARPPCLHSLARRHAAESMTAAADCIRQPRSVQFDLALTVRMRFLQFLAARLASEELLGGLLEQRTRRLSGGSAGSVECESMQYVLECLNQLESALLDASRQQPFSDETAELLSAIAFQREAWSRAIACLQEGDVRPAALAPPARLATSMAAGADPSARVVFRRQLPLASAPILARLVLSGVVPVTVFVNDVPLAQRFLPQETDASPHALIAVIDVTAQFRAGENHVDLVVEGGRSTTGELSAVLELGFRDGSRTSVQPDSEWRWSAVIDPGSPPPEQGVAPWNAAVLKAPVPCTSAPADPRRPQEP